MSGGGAKTISSESPRLSTVRINQSAYGAAITWLRGTNRIAGNVIDYDDFVAIPHTTTDQMGGKGGSGGGMKSTTYTYTCAVAVALCEGVVQGIGQVWSSKDKTTLGALGLTLFTGTLPQSPWGYMTSRHPDKALGYPGIAYVASGALDLGDSAMTPNLSFEVKGPRALGELVVGEPLPDARPDEILTDMLTDPLSGVGFDGARLHGLTAYRTYCQAAGFFVSPAISEQSAAVDHVRQLMQMTNSDTVWSEGKLKIVPYADSVVTGNGATYTPDVTPLFDLTDDDFLPLDDLSVIRINRKRPADAFNRVQVEFNNRAIEYNTDLGEARDGANIAQFGLRPKDPVQMHWITRKEMADQVADLIMRRDLYILNEYEIKLGWRYAMLEAMDIITLTHAPLGLNRATVRIISAEESEDGDIDMLVEEMPWAIATPARVITQGGSGTAADFNVAPGNSNTPVIFEPPLSLAGRPEIWFGTSGGSTWGGCEIWVSLDNATYSRVGNVTSPARHGTLTALMASGSDPDVSTTVAVDLGASRATLLSGTQIDRDLLNTLCYVDGELISYQDAALTGSFRYSLTSLRRGAYGSPVGSHVNGAAFMRLDSAVFRYAFDKSYIGKTLYIKLRSFNIYGGALQDLAVLTPVTFAIAGAPVGSVGGLVAEQPFTGTAARVKWNTMDGAARYKVEVWAAAAMRRSLETTDTRFAYSFEDAKSDGGPWRTLQFKVYGITETGLSTTPATLQLTNSQIAAPTAVRTTALLDGLGIKCALPADTDYAGCRVHASQTSGFTPDGGNLVYDGPDSNFAWYGLTAGDIWYLRIGCYDVFGTDSITWSSEQAVTVRGIRTSPADILFAINGQVAKSTLVPSLASQIDQIDTAGPADLPNGLIAKVRSQQSAMATLQDSADTIGQRLLESALKIQDNTDRLYDAGLTIDAGTGEVYLYGVRQAEDRLDTAEIRLDAAESSLALKVSAAYVDSAIATAVINPSQVAELGNIYARLGTAEIELDGLDAAVALKAAQITVDSQGARLTTAESDIDALQGEIVSKVENSTFSAAAARLTTAESRISAYDNAGIINTVSDVRALDKKATASAEALLRNVLTGEYTLTEMRGSVATARSELTAYVDAGLNAEATARTALAGAVDANAAAILNESGLRVTAVDAVAADVMSLGVTVAGNTAAINNEVSTRSSETGSLAASVSSLQSRLDTGGDVGSAIVSAQSTASTAVTNAAAAQSTANGKVKTFFQASAPTATGIGDLWVDTDDSNHLYRWSGAAWDDAHDARITSTASTLSTLQTTVGDHTATISTQATSIDGLSAQAAIKIDNNGYITGIGLASEPVDGVPYSTFAVLANAFLLGAPDGVKQPFALVDIGGGVYKMVLKSDVLISGNVDIANLTSGSLPSDVIMRLGGGTIQLDGMGEIRAYAGLGANEDFVRLTAAQIQFQRYIAGTGYVTYNYLSRIEAGQANSGDTVTIPGYWKQQPKVMVSPAGLALYKVAYAAQDQSISCLAGALQETSAGSGRWQFNATATLNLAANTGTTAVNESSGVISANAFTSSTKTTGSNCTSITPTVAFLSSRGNGTSQYFRRSIRWRVEYFSGGIWLADSYRVVNIGDQTSAEITDSFTFTFPSAAAWQWRIYAEAYDTDGTAFGSVSFTYSQTVSTLVANNGSDFVVNTNTGGNYPNYTPGGNSGTVPFSAAGGTGEIYEINYSITMGSVSATSTYSYNPTGPSFINATGYVRITASSLYQYSIGSQLTNTNYYVDSTPRVFTKTVAGSNLSSTLNGITYSTSISSTDDYPSNISMRVASGYATVKRRTPASNSTVPSNKFSLSSYTYALTAAQVLASGSLNWLAVGQ